MVNISTRRRIVQDDIEVPVIPRKQFVEDFGKNYHAGQHVTLLGPSGRGKTRLGGQMLVSVLRHHPEIKARVLHGKIKGRDTTIEKLSKAGKLPIVSSWPPSLYSRYVKHRNARGYVLRPLEHAEDSTDIENKHIAGEFRRAIHGGYHTSSKHPIILVVDEAHQAHNDLGLRKDCEGPLMRGRPVCGVWSFIQRGRHVSYMVYDQAEDVIIFFDPDVDNQRRYSEIGGVDPRILIELSKKLETKTVADGSTISQAIWFKRSGNMLAIVDT